MKGKFPASFFSSHAPVAQTKRYLNARDVEEFFLLKPGEYLIVPATFQANETASFLLTIFSKVETHGYENSGDLHHEVNEKIRVVTNAQEDQRSKELFRQNSDKYEEVDAEQLQILLNEKILKGNLKTGFSIDACRSMVALMDSSITGKLNSKEFTHLWRKVVQYKDMFFLTDVSKTGMLSLIELRNAFQVSGLSVGDSMLSLMALRYGASSGHMTLENFISLMLRLNCMTKIFTQLSSGEVMSLKKAEWLYVSMYT
ncbi:calpain-1 catalytic subunit-like [Aulostomus maculatus]